MVGGNESAEASQDWSARDAYGAKLMVVRGDKTTAYNYACSEGLSVQNSRKLHIGMGGDTQIDTLTVLWPSGRTTVLNDVKAGRSLTLYENESAASDD